MPLDLLAFAIIMTRFGPSVMGEKCEKYHENE